MAYDLKGDLCEEVTDDPLLSRSPTADPRDRPAGRGLLAPDRSAVPGQPLLRRAAVADLPPHRLDPTPTPSRRQPRRTGTGGLGAAAGVGPTAARCHAGGIAPAARCRVQHHGHLSRPEEAGTAAEEEGPARPGAGPPGRPGATTGILRGAGRRGPTPAGLRGRVRGQYGDDPHSRPGPRRAARLRRYPRQVGFDHADLR